MINIEEGQEKARELEVMHYDVSAKSGYNINALFKFLAGMVSGNEQSILVYTNSLNISSINIGIIHNKLSFK